MIGGRVGIKLGGRVGGAIGLGADAVAQNNPLAGVTRDATSGIYRPQTATEWNTVLSAAGVTGITPLYGMNCQVASGDATALYGTVTGLATGTLSYQQAVSGWTARCIKTTDNTLGALRSNAAALPDIGTTSFAMLSYVLFPASSAGDRTIQQMGAGFAVRVAMDSDASNRIVGIASPNATNGSTGNWGATRPVFNICNRNASIARVGTNAEILSPALAANPTGQRVILGGDFTDTWNPGGEGFVDSWGFTGDMTQANMKAILQTVGWTVAW